MADARCESGELQQRINGPEHSGSSGGLANAGKPRLQKRIGGGKNVEPLQPRGGPEPPSDGGALFPPGPGDVDAWRELLAVHPELEPARCYFDWLCDGLGDAGLLPVRASGVVATGAFRKVAILRDRERGRLVGRYLGVRIACERAQAAQVVGVQAEERRMGEPAQVDAAIVPPKAESELRGCLDELATRMDERSGRLRAGGNGVVALQGAVALTELMRRVCR